MCCQNNVQGRKWLVTKSDEQLIIDMLQDKISMRDAFLKNSQCRLSIFYGRENVVKEKEEEDWGDESIFLPKKNEFIEAEEGEFDDDIEYFQNRLKKRNCSGFSYGKVFQVFTDATGGMTFDMEFMLEVQEDYECNISGYVSKTLKIIKELHLLETYGKRLGYHSFANVEKETARKISFSSKESMEQRVRVIIDEVEEDWACAA